MDPLWTQLQTLLTCAATELTAAAVPVPANVAVVHGQVAWDDCCEGQLWVRVVRSWPSSTFPLKDSTLRPCGTRTATQIGLGILRCATDLDTLGWASNPSMAALTADARLGICDIGALYRALACCDDLDTRVVDQWTPLGPQGGCFGGEWTAWLAGSLSCPDESPGSGS